MKIEKGLLPTKHQMTITSRPTTINFIRLNGTDLRNFARNSARVFFAVPGPRRNAISKNVSNVKCSFLPVRNDKRV